MSIQVKVFVGHRDEAGVDIRLSQVQDAIRTTLREHRITAYTLYEAEGHYNGNTEDCTVIEHIGGLDSMAALERVARDLTKALNQESTLLTVVPVTSMLL